MDTMEPDLMISDEPEISSIPEADKQKQTASLIPQPQSQQAASAASSISRYYIQKYVRDDSVEERDIKRQQAMIITLT